MDRDGINLSCLSDVYERGVEEFIQFAERNANRSSDGVKSRCPCINYLNKRR